mmetsp:Transcript_2580/g.5501  ORF Transcript_2580/g.5501 Transcript_2580/m.5501 type:complete len:248 (-) Transcript_2580:71-814(-)
MRSLFLRRLRLNETERSELKGMLADMLGGMLADISVLAEKSALAEKLPASQLREKSSSSARSPKSGSGSVHAGSISVPVSGGMGSDSSSVAWSSSLGVVVLPPRSVLLVSVLSVPAGTALLLLSPPLPLRAETAPAAMIATRRTTRMARVMGIQRLFFWLLELPPDELKRCSSTLGREDQAFWAGISWCPRMTKQIIWYLSICYNVLLASGEGRSLRFSAVPLTISQTTVLGTSLGVTMRGQGELLA